ncbi:MAG: enoyl-CoA hydratase, partial [Alphaproteobacteria bacterium]|nr:enoyl-CoA hydratase [Alphaproteobacteria bacterium]
MTDEPVLLRTDTPEGVTTLTLNRPQARNALSMELMAAMIDALTAIGEDDGVRVVVIAGAGPAFCAGHDLREMRAHNEPDFIRLTFESCSQLMQAVVALPQPAIARVHGVATAAGCQLVASCDLAVAAENSRFATPGVNIGLFCSTPMVALT